MGKGGWGDLDSTDGAASFRSNISAERSTQESAQASFSSTPGHLLILTIWD